jgi:hypothetical protein
MEGIINWLLDGNTLAFFVSFGIFCATFWLLTDNKIGFWMTLMLLSFSLLFGYVIANQDLLASFIKSWMRPCEVQTEHPKIKQAADDKPS